MPSARSESNDQRSRSGRARGAGQLNDLDATQRRSSRSRDFDTSRRNVPVGDSRYGEDNMRRGTHSSSRDLSHDEPGMYSPPEEDPWSFRDQQGRVEPRSSFSRGRRDGSVDASSRRDARRRKGDRREDRSSSMPRQNSIPPEATRTSGSGEGRMGRSSSRDLVRDSPDRIQRSASKDTLNKDSKEKPKKSKKEKNRADQGPRDLKYLDRDRGTMARVNSNGALNTVGNTPTGNRSSGNRPTGNRSSGNRPRPHDPPPPSYRDQRPPRQTSTNGSVEIPMESTRTSHTNTAPAYTTGGANYAFVSCCCFCLFRCTIR